tara:strand:- start:605 stop:991 length:387 start_codon:yes stop_codon:yes gene_type:complete
MVLATKFGVGILCFILGVAGYPLWYRIYLKAAVGMTEEQYHSYNGISDFGYCLAGTMQKTALVMENCDGFFLGYLPAQTKNYKKGGHNPLGKLSSEQVKNTYKVVQSIRSGSGLEPYPALGKLSHGLL